MSLVRMIYISKPSDVPKDQYLEGILKVARTNNVQHELTGLMVFDHQYFLQVIEGGRAAVSRLLGNLYKDSRHTDLTMLEFDSIASRMFSEWSMQFVPVASLTKGTLLRHSANSKFDPMSLTKASALELLADLRNLAPH